MSCDLTHRVGGMDYDAVDADRLDAGMGLQGCCQCDLAGRFRDCLAAPACCPQNGRTDGRTIGWRVRQGNGGVA